jgi:hypothetical protein
MGHPEFAVVSIAIRTLLGLVFTTAALGKMRRWLEFRGVVANYRLLPDAWVAPVAQGLPPLEALLGVALIMGWGTPLPEVAAAALLSVFAVAMAINIARGRTQIDCGCFQSGSKQTLRWTLVARNAVLAVLAGVAAWAAAGVADVWLIIEGTLAGAVLFGCLTTLNLLWSITPAWRRRQGSAARALS